MEHIFISMLSLWSAGAVPSTPSRPARRVETGSRAQEKRAFKSFIAYFYMFGKCPIHVIVLVYEANPARKIIRDLQGIACWGNKTTLLSME